MLQIGCDTAVSLGTEQTVPLMNRYSLIRNRIRDDAGGTISQIPVEHGTSLIFCLATVAILRTLPRYLPDLESQGGEAMERAIPRWWNGQRMINQGLVMLYEMRGRLKPQRQSKD